MIVNPKFQSLIPPLSPEEFDQLQRNILNEGCRDPLVIWNETLIDGHNRLSICNRLGIPFSTASLEFSDEDEACIWIIQNQKGRRNLSAIDRIALSAKLEEIIARKAKANKIEAGKQTGRGNKKVSAILPTPLHTRTESAKAAAVGERTYDAGKLILDAAEKGIIEPEVVEDIRRDRKSLHAVAKEIKERLQREARAEKREAASNGSPLDTRIIIGDFREHADKIPDGALSLIFTDPPYDREASRMLPELAHFSAAKLADGGSLICYVGQTQIPAAIDALRTHLRYWWTIACIHAGRSTVMREYGINAGWKAVLWFVKGTRDDNSVMVSDVMSGGEEKSHHDWQQAQSEAEYWIEKLCPDKGIVCDPFLGSGTTAAAAQKLNRKWIAFERDDKTAAIASARLA